MQRELFGNMSVEVAYSGMYSDRVDRTIQESYVPESYYSTNVTSRDASAQTLLQQQVTNPFHIDNFASLRTSDPVLYQRLANNAFFQARTTQRQNLIRAFPQLGGNNLQFQNLPLGIVKAHSLEVTVNRRYSNGLSANMAFSLNDVTENRVVEAYDREPTVWQPSQDARPFRIAGGAVYEFPFGRNKAFLNQGGVLANIVGGWQMGGTFEYQPGALLEFGQPVLQRQPRRHQEGQSGNCPSARWHARPVEDVVQRGRGLREGLRRFSRRRSRSARSRSESTACVAPGTSWRTRTSSGTSASAAAVRCSSALTCRTCSTTCCGSNPNVDPTSTNFGKVTGATNSIMRFFTFVWKVNF